MPNTIEYKQAIVAHMIATLRDVDLDLGYQVAEFYGTATPESLIEYIKGRLNTGSGTVFVRVGRIDRTAIDTVGKMYDAKFACELIVGSQSAAREDQQIDAERFTDKMLVDVASALVDAPVTLDGHPYSFWLGTEQDLFRDAGAGGLDVQILNATVENVSVEY